MTIILEEFLKHHAISLLVIGKYDMRVCFTWTSSTIADQTESRMLHHIFSAGTDEDLLFQHSVAKWIRMANGNRPVKAGITVCIHSCEYVSQFVFTGCTCWDERNRNWSSDTCLSMNRNLQAKTPCNRTSSIWQHPYVHIIIDGPVDALLELF